jgi:glycosyltransferase involved in cell wall biosynthesis
MSGRWEPNLISVVVPTHNRCGVLLRVLAGFERQTLPAARFEVIVVDDGSSDGTPAQVEAYAAGAAYPLTLLRQPNQGPAAARNQGLARARGEVIVFVDDDCVPHPELLARHAAAHETRGLAVIGRITWHPDLPATPFMRYAEPNMFFPYQAIAVPFDATFICFYTGNASVDAASARAAGGFDPDFPRAGYEDIDFGYRLRRHGVRITFEPAALVYHYRTAELLPTLERSRMMGRELVRFWTKHPELHAFIPIADLIDPGQRQRFYEVLGAYYLALGMQDALGEPHRLDAGELVPANFADVLRAWADRRVEELQHEARTLRQECDQLRLLRRQDAAEYQRLATWAAELEAQCRRLQQVVAATPPPGLSARLRRRLASLGARLRRGRAAVAPPAAARRREE